MISLTVSLLLLNIAALIFKFKQVFSLTSEHYGWIVANYFNCTILLAGRRQEGISIAYRIFIRQSKVIHLHIIVYRELGNFQPIHY